MDRAWIDALQKELMQQGGDKKGLAVFHRYANAFPTSYTEDCPAENALQDILRMEKLTPEHPIDLHLYHTQQNDTVTLHLKLFQFEKPIPLSDILPMLENMDLRVYNERPYTIALKDIPIWISDFIVTYVGSRDQTEGVSFSALDIEKIKDNFQEAFIKIRFGLAENDGFNKLVLGAELTWREIIILRAYAKYLRQIGFRFSQDYIQQALIHQTDITTKLIQLFKTRHDPNQKVSAKKAAEQIETDILQALENVSSLDEDRIIRTLLQLMKATLRTNYFQNKEYLSCKLSSKEIPDLPLPLPLYEIFVYSPRFEAIHLRNAKVARGGIRWSDRREDFRTEVLGLMKAQKVKNAVIVPSGAKGGFVLKCVPPNASRDVVQQEVVFCYKSFIRGLLDLTDNLKDEKVVHPPHVVCFDDADPYLVVAADKGTATFSDTANSISNEYQFWLGDGFASGGSAGYDHKKMGITARGAWESIKRHFHELNIHVAETDFTVAGIGDMSGDVFGNGMLYSPHIKLVAAFDHRHIFLDPDPDPKIAYQERQRLFNLPSSSWEDYNTKLISPGGGVYKRSSKLITLSPAMKKVLDIQEDSFVPQELVRAILKAPVDLLFNGGIGTYVKASTESHAEVGDKTNEFCRINGNELRCRVVGEGGNLGFTQLGRVEYSLNGGLINTDFIDNSAGVDCSDHEVNLKILLNNEIAKGRLNAERRNTLLAKMTQEVADLVLQDNYHQALVMSIAQFFAKQNIGIHQNYIKDLESSGVIKRTVEFLPDDKKLLERKAAGLGLTRPELAVLLAYTKIHIKNAILASDIPEDKYFSKMLDTAFPATLHKSYREAMSNHRLHREIIATQLSNHIVNETGTTFVYNLQTETGATVAEIIRAYTVSSEIFGAYDLQELIIHSLDYKIPMALQYELLNHIRHLMILSTRWFIRHKPITPDNIATIITHFSKHTRILEEMIPHLMAGFTKDYLESLCQQFIKAGISKDIARRIAVSRAMYTSLNITEVATQHHLDLTKVAQFYFAVGEQFHLLWFRDRIAHDTREGYWDTLARFTLRDELDTLQTQLTVVIMKFDKKRLEVLKAIDQWKKNHLRAMERWDKILHLLHGSTTIDYAMFFVALSELSDLIQH